MRTKEIAQAIVAIIICEAAGIIGSIFTTPAIPTWYAGLTKGPLNPPSWVFGPVWTTLFALMGIAVYLVWKKGKARPEVRSAVIVFGVQLVLNVMWSILFFGLQSPGFALIEIGIFWLAIAFTIWKFAKVSRTAAWLLVPYILWVSFASYLNYTIWVLNK